MDLHRTNPEGTGTVDREAIRELGRQTCREPLVLLDAIRRVHCHRSAYPEDPAFLTRLLQPSPALSLPHLCDQNTKPCIICDTPVTNVYGTLRHAGPHFGPA